MTKIDMTLGKGKGKKKLDTNTKQTITDAKSPVFHRINARWHAKKDIKKSLTEENIA